MRLASVERRRDYRSWTDGKQRMAGRCTKSIAVSVLAVGVATLAILIGLGSNRRAECSTKGLRTKPMAQSHSRWRRLWKLPPQWLVFLVSAGALVTVGFSFLPPNQSRDLSGQSSPIIDVSVSRPDVHLLAVLDASQADSGDIYLGLYANGVSGGFRWLITSSDSQNDLSTTGAIADPGQWTDKLTGEVPSSDSVLYFLLTTQSFTPDLQSVLRASKYTPTVERGVRLDTSSFSLAGANFQAMLPTLEFSRSQTSSSPTGWYAPNGEVVILSPNETQTYQTNTVNPAFSSPGMWLASPQVTAPYWSGTDLAVQAQEDRYLFIAGLLFGISGSALIACFQDIAIRYRSWRARRDPDARQSSRDSASTPDLAASLAIRSSPAEGLR